MHFEAGERHRLGSYTTPRNYAAAAKEYEKAVVHGHVGALRELALLHMYGRGVPQSFDRSQKLFFRAATQDDPASQYYLGRLLVTGKAGEMSIDDGVGWITKSAESGFPDAQATLGSMMIEGDHLPRDQQTGFRWIRTAADQDHPSSLYVLAKLYEDGDGVPRDLERARMYYRRSAEAGYDKALVWVAHWHLDQDLPDHLAALRAFKDAARQGNADANFGIAELHLGRKLRASSSQEGLEHLRIAADRRHPGAHYLLGRMYGDGTLSGGSAKALEHFAMSASLGHREAMYQLGIAHYKGTNPLKKDDIRAAYWWRKAAYKGHVESQFSFGLMHIQGRGVQRNRGIGWALMNVAAAQGHDPATKQRELLRPKLSEIELKEAQELSVQLFSEIVDKRAGNHL